MSAVKGRNIGLNYVYDAFEEHRRTSMLMHANIKLKSMQGVCFFADDDNVYSKTLLRRMQSIRRVGVWAASHMCITETRSKVGVPISYLLCDEGATVGPGTGGKHRVSGFCAWQGSPARRFQLDFAQFAVNLGFALERRGGRVLMDQNAISGRCETQFLESTGVQMSELELLDNTCGRPKHPLALKVERCNRTYHHPQCMTAGICNVLAFAPH